MKKILTWLVIGGIALSTFSCKKTGESESGSNLRKANGGRYYGGVFKLNESEFLKTLFPHNITDAVSTRIASQIYEGLFKFDPSDLSVKKCLVQDYTVDTTGLVYTFKLKKNVFFHDDPCFEGGKGRLLTAKDVAYCFTLLATQNANNQGYTSFKGLIKGADAHYNASANGASVSSPIEGIKVVDDHTIQMFLTQPSSMFLSKLAMPFAYIFPKEAFDKYGLDLRVKAVGSGPFILQNVDDEMSVILKRNDKYHGVDEFNNKLPFLDAVDIRFIKDKKNRAFRV